MAVTAQQVYNAALVLIDEVLETGNIVPDQPQYYQAKSLSLLTTLQTELLPISQTPVIVTSLSQNMAVSDKIALLVLPYGLAAHLLLTDDPNTAAFLNARYDELKKKIPTQPVKITDVYGVSSGMRW